MGVDAYPSKGDNISVSPPSHAKVFLFSCTDVRFRKNVEWVRRIFDESSTLWSLELPQQTPQSQDTEFWRSPSTGRLYQHKQAHLQRCFHASSDVCLTQIMFFWRIIAVLRTMTIVIIMTRFFSTKWNL